MVNIELMSNNLVLLLTEIVSIQEIAKYLNYNSKNPLGEPDLPLPAKNLIMKKLHPYPFDPISQTEDETQIRVYYPEGEFDGSGAVAHTFIHIDIVTAKSLWLINDGNGKSSVRPYMIMKHLLEHFTKVSISTLGRVHITNFVHLHINEKFDAIRLEANVTLFGE